MDAAMIGLGEMGVKTTIRLLKGGLRVVVFDFNDSRGGSVLVRKRLSETSCCLPCVGKLAVMP